ncbi:chromate efflux transporter [Gilvimarinus agarilyticus]|uniref:chromate efflux transporter n=1 Tax=Gilvimarinus agarilyticus TaxID=679259 RepID=UPI00059FFFD5|nr:chromate efflux transporter [Gilvimarinus agarilyticus]
MNESAAPRRRALEVLSAFLWLGLTSFGGPIAHLGYFREEFVARRRWLTEHEYADLVALSQFLPGPASSQVGFALGLFRAGPLGGLLAWLAFTLPSALLMIIFALTAHWFDSPLSLGVIHGLKVVAVAIVAHAVWAMARTLCPDKTRTIIAIVAIYLVVLVSGTLGQLAAITLGAIGGLMCYRRSDLVDDNNELVSTHSRSTFALSARVGKLAGALFFVLLLVLPVLALGSGNLLLQLADVFYRVGALVFGGGHVALPLLEAELVQPGWIDQADFLAGYGAAQAIPGPLFAFSAYLGVLLDPASHNFLAAIVALVAIFLPGILLLLAVLPVWSRIRKIRSVRAMMLGANAAVVGILGAALYDPVWTSAIVLPQDFVLALTGFLLLAVWRTPSWLVVIVLACASGLLAL